jgi:hypothetical protein
MQLKYDLTGQAFNSWQVLEFAYQAEDKKSYWRCRCTGCQTEKLIEGYNLKSNRSRSCRRCSAAFVGASVHRTHGRSRSIVYRRWSAMKTRCTNPKAKSWKDHGGRGILVCEEWMHDFMAFYDHIGDPPTPRHTVDRINNTGHYEPGNVKWSTQSEQMQNTRRSRKNRQDQPPVTSSHKPDTPRS